MIVDFHCDTMSILLGRKGESELKKNEFHVDIEKMKRAGSLAQFFALFVDSDGCKSYGVDPFDKIMRMKEVFYREIEKNKDEIAFAGSYDDYCLNKQNEKISAFLTVEDGGIIEDDLENIKLLYKEGVRLITLTWNYENSIGYPSCDNRNLGLKKMGFDVVELMEDLGMIVDVSHLSDSGFKDVMKVAKKPFVASHSNSRIICNQARNLEDWMIKDIANSGGIIGINYFGEFLSRDKESTVTHMIKHIEHIRNKGGEDVLALGSDFDGIHGPLEIENIGEMAKLIDGLRKSGYSQRFIDKITFKNGERVIKELL